TGCRRPRRRVLRPAFGLGACHAWTPGLARVDAPSRAPTLDAPAGADRSRARAGDHEPAAPMVVDRPAALLPPSPAGPPVPDSGLAAGTPPRAALSGRADRSESDLGFQLVLQQ